MLELHSPHMKAFAGEIPLRLSRRCGLLANFVIRSILLLRGSLPMNFRHRDRDST